MRLCELFENVSYRLAGNLADLEQEILLVSADVHRAGRDTLYVLVRTALRNSSESVAAAYRAGCRAFLTDKPVHLPEDAAVFYVSDAAALAGELAARCFGNPERHLTVIGITGTAGKSSVAHTLTALLHRSGRRVASLTTDGVRIGHAVRPAGTVVPDACEIAELLREFYEKGIELAVLELSAYQLLHKVAFSIPFAAVLLTNLTPAHVGKGEFESFEAYRAAKLSLFAKSAPYVILPCDVSVPRPCGQVVTFGKDGDFAAEQIEPYFDDGGIGTRFFMRFPNGEKVKITLPVPGDFAIENALATAALASIVGIMPSRIAKWLSVIRPHGRMQCFGSFEGRVVCVDSAYEADDLKKALCTLRSYTEGRLTVLLGSVGGRARWRRAALGRVAADYADFVYLTADDPDFESVEQICYEMMEAGDPERSCVISDRRLAIVRAISELREQDILLIAGKGGCETQLICGVRERFSDPDVAEETCLSLYDA